MSISPTAMAIVAFNLMLQKYGDRNIYLGITHFGKTKLISDALDEVARHGRAGSLWEAYKALEAVKITPEMSPFLTEAIKRDLKNQIVQNIANIW